MGHGRDSVRGLASLQLRGRPSEGPPNGLLRRRHRCIQEAKGTKLFLDTGAFVARYVPDDRKHADALSVFRDIRSGRLAFKALFTSNFVIDETVTRILHERGHRDAVAILGLLRGDPSLHILHVTEDLEPEIDREFARYRDSRVSYTDCSSKVLMERHGISSIFSFDEDFETVGLNRIP